MNIKEYREILNEELKSQNPIESNIRILNAKKQLLETKNDEILQILQSVDGKSIEETISILDTYLKNDNSNMSSSKSRNMTLSNHMYKGVTFLGENDNGFSNIVLISLALIIIVIILFAIILV